MHNSIVTFAAETVVGDIHGHFEQFTILLLISGGPALTPMLFLGDYVNYGHCSLKVRAVSLLHGNVLFLLSKVIDVSISVLAEAALSTPHHSSPVRLMLHRIGQLIVAKEALTSRKRWVESTDYIATASAYLQSK